MRLLPKHNTRHWLPGVVFAAILFSTHLHAESLKPKAVFTLDIPAQTRDINRRGTSGVEYVRPGTLGVWYTEKGNDGKLSRRDKLDAGDPWRFNLQLVSTSDGSLVRKLAWPTRKHSSALVVPFSGIPVLLTGPVVHCFSPDFHEIRSFVIKGANQPKELRILRPSPASSILWLIEASDVTTATRIDTRSCTTGWTLIERTAAATIAGNDEMLVDSNPKQVGLWSRSLGWQLLYSSECCLSNAQFVAPDMVGAVRLDIDRRRRFLLLGLKGELLLDDPVEAEFDFGGMVPSADGKTVAVVFTQRDISSTDTGIEINRIQVKIRFYDLSARKRTAELNLGVPGENRFGLALSPDHAECAVLNGPKLFLYDLRPEH